MGREGRTHYQVELIRVRDIYLYLQCLTLLDVHIRSAPRVSFHPLLSSRTPTSSYRFTMAASLATSGSNGTGDTAAKVIGRLTVYSIATKCWAFNCIGRQRCSGTPWCTARGVSPKKEEEDAHEEQGGNEGKKKEKSQLHLYQGMIYFTLLHCWQWSMLEI